MFGITDLAAYLIGTIAVILLPGPNSMYCLTIAGQYGVKTAYHSIAGILLGDSILMLATVFGAGTLLQLYPALFHGLKLIGGLYLAYIGWHLIRGAAKKYRFRPMPSETPIATEIPKNQAHNVFKRALTLSLINPKAILFFLSFFVQFVDPAYPNPLLTFLVLALILQSISFSYLTALAFAGSHLVQAFRRHIRLSAIAMGMVGIMFIGFALKMWTAGI